MLTGQNFRDGVTPLGGVWDSVDIFPVSVKETSQLAMYWPYAVMQDGDNGFRLVTYLGAASGGPWTNRSLGVSGPEGTGMAIIPRTSTYKAPSTAGLLYRGIDGILAGYSVQWDLPGLDWDFGMSQIFSPDIPSHLSFYAANHRPSIKMHLAPYHRAQPSQHLR